MKNGFLIILLLFAFGCKSPKARKPIVKKSGHFLKESVARNKALQARQEKRIQQIIKQDTAHKFYTAPYGFWYYYNQKNTTDTITPQTGDLVKFKYSISTLEGQPIYTEKEIGLRVNVIDKENLFSGLRHGLKLMKKGETVTFYFPSYMAFGYYGDQKKIGRNLPLKVTATLQQITPNTIQKQPK